MSDTVTPRAAGGGGGGSIGVNGTMCLETKIARRARASLRALEMGSVTSSLRDEVRYNFDAGLRFCFGANVT